ncbi:MAG: hypothetical protein AB7O52_11100 [Planctomycetota bacterium]
MSRERPRYPWFRQLSALVGTLLLTTACSVLDVHRSQGRLDPDGGWVILPWENRAEAPRAGERLEPVLKTLLLGRGVLDVASTPPAAESATGLPNLDPGEATRQARDWAATQGFKYAVQGSITEWRYKAGLDGEPAVGLTVTVVELASGRTVWSASGARAGWGRESLSGAAQKLLRRLLASLDFEET